MLHLGTNHSLGFLLCGVLLAAAEDGVCRLESMGDGTGARGSPRVTVTETGSIRVAVSNRWGGDWKSISAVIRTHVCDFPPQLV